MKGGLRRVMHVELAKDESFIEMTLPSDAMEPPRRDDDDSNVEFVMPTILEPV